MRITRAMNRLFANRHPALVLGVGVLLAAVVGALDYFTGFELSLAILYLLPIALVTWYARRWAGLALCCLCGAIWVAANYAAGQTYSHWSVFVENAVVHLGVFLVTATLLATVNTYVKRQQLLARTDGLTEVLNNRAFGEISDRLVLLAARHRHPLALAYIDIDDFKGINDSLGHSAGDEVLRTVGTTLMGCLRLSDVVGRLGGDEFVVLMPETGRHGAEAALAKVHRALNNEAEQRGWPIGFSIGVALFRTGPANLDEALKAADRLMYRVKREGKNNVLYEEQPVGLAGAGTNKGAYPQPGTSGERVMRLLSGR